MNNVTPLRRTAFVSADLAPLPESAELRAAPEFIRMIREDDADRWRRSMAYVRMTDALREAAWFAWCIARDEGGDTAKADRDRDKAEAAHFAAVDRQMRLSAPAVGDLRWKQGSCKYDGGLPVWREAIARDEAALADKLKMLSRRKKRSASR